jgi:hypothetical protein
MVPLNVTFFIHHLLLSSGGTRPVGPCVCLTTWTLGLVACACPYQARIYIRLHSGARVKGFARCPQSFSFFFLGRPGSPTHPYSLLLGSHPTYSGRPDCYYLSQDKIKHALKLKSVNGSHPESRYFVRKYPLDFRPEV